ncbi:MAG: hypothetical protein QGH63_12190 [Rhodospirillales bacterium]|jgi:hypothetical protein|nr:hypothetical protein [Rhodospirillales bacterium]MDP7425275.1 hypothetical protein [Rhodospirillales bacterium]HJO87140.1 hypothetical protein [Rhodospirillales bacterium]
MKECSKTIMRRLHEPNFANRYFDGNGLDVGGRPDPLGLYVELFLRMLGVKVWDKEDDDSQKMIAMTSSTLLVASNISTIRRHF